MKSLLKMLLLVALVGSMAVACGGDENPNGGGSETPEVPQEEVKPEVAPPTNADVPTKIPCTINKVVASEEGVSIEVTKVTNDNFVFVARPGDYVQSYRLDVFPLCRLYNSLYEQMRSEGKSEASARDVDEWIRSFVFNSTGAGAFTFSSTSHDDYLEKEFDWMNSIYSQAKVVPDAEYIIVAVACYDTEGVEDGEMSICYVKTKSESLVGNPRVTVSAKTNYRAMEVTHIPNADCKYLYYWCSNESDLMPYINIYGDKLYIDFMRHTISDAIAANDEANLSYYRDFGQSADSRVPIMATAIALDKNQTPAKEFDSAVFTLQEIPDDMQPGSGEIRVMESKLGANYFWYEYDIAANTPVILWKAYTVKQAEYYKTQATEAELRALAEDIDYDGWGLVNEKYSQGQPYSSSTVWYATPDTEYVIGYTARNKARELSPVKFTEPFRTKPIVTNTPEACQSNGVLTLEPQGRTSIKIKVNYDFEKHAGIRFQYIEPVLEGSGQPLAEDSRDTYLAYFKYTVAAEDSTSIINDWHGEPAGEDGFVMAGLTPGTKYKFAYLCEDWNGVVGPVQFAEASTMALEGGDNPSAAIDAVIENGVCKFVFVANEQTEYMKYMVGTPMTDGDDALKLTQLGSSTMTGDDFYRMWQTYCLSNGLQTYNLQANLSEDSAPAIAICIPFGRNDIRGAMTYAIYDGKSIKQLSDYYPSYVGYSKILEGVLPSIASPRAHKAVPAAQLREERTVDSDSDVKIRTLFVDMQRLSSHPHASLK